MMSEKMVEQIDLRTPSSRETFKKNNNKISSKNCQNQLCPNSGLSKVYNNRVNIESRKRKLKIRRKVLQYFSLSYPNPFSSLAVVLKTAAYIPSVEPGFLVLNGTEQISF